MECKACKGGVCYAHGGEVDLMDHVHRRRMSKGGMVANETKPMVDSKEAEYDDLVLRDDLDFSYTGKNSGDELGEDMISRVRRRRQRPA